jgi:HAMP domain-containing protein
MSLSVHNYLRAVATTSSAIHEASRSAVHKTLNEIASVNLDRKEIALINSVTDDLGQTEKKAGRIFDLRSPAGRDKTLAADLVTELDSLLAWMGHDIEKYQKENAIAMDTVLNELFKNKMRTNALFLIMLITSISFLFAFGLYIHRKVSVPLNDLWAGTEAISRGNLDFQIQVHGEGDIAQLGGRFNEMAQRLKQSYDELERKLFDRTRELAALDAVALTLSQAGTLKDVLDKSLARILDSLAGIEPKGGVFLCEPGGELLSLVAHKGLSPEFVEREAVIKMGECLCGMVRERGAAVYGEQLRCSRPYPRPQGRRTFAHHHPYQVERHRARRYLRLSPGRLQTQAIGRPDARCDRRPARHGRRELPVLRGGEGVQRKVLGPLRELP